MRKKNEQMNLQYHVSALDAHFDSICLSSDAQMAEIFKNQNTLKEWRAIKPQKEISILITKYYL